MYLLDLSLPTPAENLALEEALLEWAETHQAECLRLWESAKHFVVMGAGSPIKSDVNLSECNRMAIPVLRRCSGGGTVLQGPGCLNYTLVLDQQSRSGLESIASTNKLVLGTIAEALAKCGIGGTAMQGYSDLTQGPLKFSGNSQRRRKRFILFHGTVLHNFDLDLISQCLGTPEKMPDYRANRQHQQFITNIPVNVESARKEIAAAWDATVQLTNWPEMRTAELAQGRYADHHWIHSI